MIAEAKAFWDAISGKVKSLVHKETENALRLQRYDVTTAPNGTVMGVTQPFGNNELFLPYSQEVAGAAVGDTVLVAWWGSMSNAKVYYFAKGYEGAEVGPYASQVNITSGTADLNDYTAAGLYHFQYGVTLLNAPNSAANGWLTVLRSPDGNVKQIWERQGSNPTTFKDVFIRLGDGTEWGSWWAVSQGWKELTKTYQENSYVTSAGFNSIFAYSDGRSVSFRINLPVAASPGSTLRTIGRFNFPRNLVSTADIDIASQSNNSTLLLSIGKDGEIRIYSAGSATGWYRTFVTIPLSN